jgi:hypothetical protein
VNRHFSLRLPELALLRRSTSPCADSQIQAQEAALKVPNEVKYASGYQLRLLLQSRSAAAGSVHRAGGFVEAQIDILAWIGKFFLRLSVLASQI